MTVVSTPYGSLGWSGAVAGLAIAALVVGPDRAWAQETLRGERFAATGVVLSIAQQQIVLIDAQDEQFTLKFPASGTSPKVQINGVSYNVPDQAELRVVGEVPSSRLEVGQVVQFQATVDRLGRIREPLPEVTIVDAETATLGLEAKDPFAKSQGKQAYVVTGKLEKLQSGRLFISVPPGPGAPEGRVVGRLHRQAGVNVRSSQYNWARPGDAIEVRGIRFAGADVLVQQGTIRLRVSKDLAGARAEASSTPSRQDSNRAEPPDKYAKYSDLPAQPRTLRSANFLLHTDLSERSARLLLDKLETMRRLIAAYYGRGQNGLIECYVVEDLAQWPAATFPVEAEVQIRENAGVTMTRPVVAGRKRSLRTIAYSCADHGVAQHEAVHAFCRLAFGSVGPSWYAEGMAEMGQYWKEGQRAVDVDPRVIGYLTSQQPKRLLDIVNPHQPPGTWQDYAWRWALCHLLEGNPNYSPHFKALGIGLMKEQDVSFEKTYGHMARQVSFEYDFFLRHLENGLRADLCAWDWSARFKPLPAGQKRRFEIVAQRGWQPTSIAVQAGNTYRVQAEGRWTLQEGAPAVSAAGDADGLGRLTGVLLDDWKLGKPIPFGDDATFEAPRDGWLYLRAAEPFSALADNDGSVQVGVSRE